MARCQRPTKGLNKYLSSKQGDHTLNLNKKQPSQTIEREPEVSCRVLSSFQKSWFIIIKNERSKEMLLRWFRIVETNLIALF